MIRSGVVGLARSDSGEFDWNRARRGWAELIAVDNEEEDEEPDTTTVVP